MSNTADAKLKVMGKKPHFFASLRLPVHEYNLLKKGTGVRKGGKSVKTYHL
jgi:hypothetical protein